MLNTRMAGCKSVLLRAWRERWTDVQWSIHVKRLVDTDNAEDMQQLADLMVSQSLVGSTPNMLVLSYLKHTISSKIISLVAALQSVIKYKDISKPYCIKSLFEVIEVFLEKISLRGTSEDAVALSTSCLGLILWLLDCQTRFLSKLAENKLSAEYTTLVERGCEVLDKLLRARENRALLFIARHDDPALFGSVESAQRLLLSQTPPPQVDPTLRDRLVTSLKNIDRIQDFPMRPRQNLDVSFHSLNISVNVVTGIDAVLYPTNPIPVLTEQLLVIERAQGLSRPDLYCELLRTCLMGMGEAAGGTDELKWASFTFLKLPHILMQLSKDRLQTLAMEELERGLHKLLDYVPLLDTTDAKCHCDCLSYFMNELVPNKHNLVTEDIYRKIINRRQAESQRQRPQEQSSQQPSACLILRAEPTLYSILKTLDTDYSKNQEPLRGVLTQMMSGKSLELILAAAAARGKVQSFAMKIVKFNELSKQAIGEGTAAAQIRATIFDITFLMLCHISQLYGLQMITSCPEMSNSFFAQWATRSLPEDGRYKSLDVMVAGDNAKVEILLGQINPGGELRNSLTRWHEVCQNVPYVMQEVLYAWEHKTLAQENVQQIVENLKFRMCCLPVVVVAWLCSFITVSDSAARQKPLQILQWFISPTTNDTSTKNNPGHPSELSNLMLAIMRRMAQDLVPQSSGSHRAVAAATLPPTQPINKALVEKFSAIFQRGCTSIEALHQMDYLMNVGGSLWFCDNIVKEVLSHDRVEDINNGVALALSVFHLDLSGLTLDLTHNVLPTLIQLPASQLQRLVDPRGRALAALAAMCLCACHKVRSISQAEGSPVKKGKKRSRTELELEEPEESLEESRAQKLRRLSSACEDLLPPSFGSDSFAVSNPVNNKDDNEPTYDASDPLSKALVNLFRLFSTVLSQRHVSPRTGFVVSFIEEILKCGSSTARYVLQFMPHNMVPQLARCLNSEFTVEILLHLCDLNSASGRKVAAKILCQHAKSQPREQEIAS